MSARPCATCPWLRQNQTKAARKSSPSGGPRKAGGEQWYSVRNLRRLWRGYQTGHPTICHSTDPESSKYGGKGAKAGYERTCVGGLILCARAMNELNRRSAQESPKSKKIWTGLFTREGVMYWIDVLMFRGTPLGVKAEQVPTEFDGAAAQEVRVPWDDPILNADALPPLETTEMTR